MTAASSLRRHPSIKPKGTGVTLPVIHPAFRSGRSLFPSRVFDPDEVQRVLKTGHQSRKIGKTVQKGRLRNAPIYTLTLEERATCERGCPAWAFCYGNGMQAAERIVAGAALETALWDELSELQGQHPRGFLVRLHVLGDFYSLAYVDLWRRALAEFPALHVFGFTGRRDAIGDAVRDLADADWNRFAVRSSGRAEPRKASVISDVDSIGVVCPAQTGASDCCATCTLCWQSDVTITFRRH